MEDTIRSTITAYLSASMGVSSKTNPELFTQYLTPDCTRTVGPATFAKAIGFEAPMDIETVKKMTRSQVGATDLVTTYEILRVVVDAPQRQAVVHLMQHHAFAGIGEEHDLEDIYMFDLSQDGKKIAKIFSYTDPPSAQKFLAAMAGAVLQASKPQGA